MNEVICVARQRDIKNNIVGYVIQDGQGNTQILTPDKLKRLIVDRRILCKNLTRTCDNRLIVKGTVQDVQVLTDVEKVEAYWMRCKLRGQYPEVEYKVFEDKVYLVKVHIRCGVYIIPDFVSGTLNDYARKNGIQVPKDRFPFSECEELKVINQSKLTNMYELFSSCHNLRKLDLSEFSTAGVTNMSKMFFDCPSLQELDLGRFDTSKVKDMSYMFGECWRLERLNLRSFDTSCVEEMAYMFYNCVSLPELDLSMFNTSNVWTMEGMFLNRGAHIITVGTREFTDDRGKHTTRNVYQTSLLRWLNLSSFDTSNVVNMSSMFYGCEALESLDLRNFNTGMVVNMSFMFKQCSSLTSLDLSSFDTSLVRTMEGMFGFKEPSMFCHCEERDLAINRIKLRKINLSSFNTSRVEDMSDMFDGCVELVSLDLSNFDTSSVKHCFGMFAGCKKLKSVNLSSFRLENVTAMSYMFTHCESLETLDLSSLYTPNLTRTTAMFRSCISLRTLKLGNMSIDNVDDMHEMFLYCGNLRNLDASRLNCGLKVAEPLTQNMFAGCVHAKTFRVNDSLSSQVRKIEFEKYG